MSDASAQADWIRERLTEALKPTDLTIRDDSHRHAGHAGAQGGGHYRVSVISVRFSGLSLMERHRLVYGVLAKRMGKEIHALGIDAKTPEEQGD